jgi:hypothetical protein
LVDADHRHHEPERGDCYDHNVCNDDHKRPDDNPTDDYPSDNNDDDADDDGTDGAPAVLPSACGQLPQLR